MSKISIEGNASGTGTFTIAAPNSNTDRTLTLPDEAGTVLTSGGAIADALNVDSAPTNSLEVDSSSNLKFNSGYGSVATAYGCRAWVNFNGTGTVAIRDSGNVSSITDNGTGQYTVNLTTAMPDINYATLATAGGLFATGTGQGYAHLGSQASTYSTSSVSVFTHRTDSDSSLDASKVMVAVFR